eukprot:gb/GEZN01004093.1/.p1 GENE.gb/GEZN01004093.1/~~gb/GEZN01004093.1/.p1  ORF type:complete len:531 (-),score=35.76 gb/GEZN01004093.1/:368-1960(-)
MDETEELDDRGYNPEWIKASTRDLEDFICSICRCVFASAVQTDNGDSMLDGEPCGHLFCHGCITRWLMDHATCPLCNSALTTMQIRPDANVRRKVRNLQVACHIDRKRCPALGTLGRDSSWWKQHEELCDFKIIQCPLCQRHRCTRGEMAGHTQVDCPSALVWCRFRCEGLMPRWEQKEHEKTCALRPMDCPQCKKQGFQQVSLSEHVKLECPETMMLCPFVDMGCEVRFRRLALEKLRVHLQESLAEHMELMAQEILSLRAEVATLRGDQPVEQSSFAGAMRTAKTLPLAPVSPFATPGASDDNLPVSLVSAAVAIQQQTTCPETQARLGGLPLLTPPAKVNKNSGGNAMGGITSPRSKTPGGPSPGGGKSPLARSSRTHGISGGVVTAAGQKIPDGHRGKETYQMFWSLVWQSPRKDVYSGTLLRAFDEDWGISFGDPEAGEGDVPVYLELRTPPKKAITVAMTISLLHPSTGLKLASKRCRHQFVKKTCWGFRCVSTLSKLQREGAFGHALGITHLLLQIEFSLIGS